MPHQSRREVLRLAALAASVTALVGCTDQDQPRALRVARPANAVATMLGVRIQTADGDSSLYGDVDLVGEALAGLGVRFVRERLYLPRYQPTQARAQLAAWRSLGSRVPRLRVTSPLGVVDNSAGTVDEFAAHLVQELGGAGGLVGTVENGNEPNSLDTPWNASDPYGWVGLTRTRQQQMAARFRPDPHLRGIGLLGPSLGGTPGPRVFARLGDLSPWLDRGNFHLYPGNYDSGLPTEGLDTALAGLQQVSGAKPVWCTETGMHQAPASTVPMSWMPEDVAAEYAVRIVLEQAAAGVERVYFFELLDDVPDRARTDSEAHFGLVRHNGRLDPKPSYVALQRLLGLLRDPGPTSAPRRLARPVTVHGLGDDGRALLARRRDGRLVLALWTDTALWDPATERRVEPRPTSVQVGLPGRHDVEVHHPGRSGAVVRRLATRRVDLEVDARVTVVTVA